MKPGAQVAHADCPSTLVNVPAEQLEQRVWFTLANEPSGQGVHAASPEAVVTQPSSQGTHEGGPTMRHGSTAEQLAVHEAFCGHTRLPFCTIAQGHVARVARSVQQSAFMKKPGVQALHCELLVEGTLPSAQGLQAVCEVFEYVPSRQNEQLISALCDV